MATEKARDGEDKKQTKRKKKKKKKKKRRSSCSSLFCPLLSSLKKVIETNKYKLKSQKTDVEAEDEGDGGVAALISSRKEWKGTATSRGGTGPWLRRSSRSSPEENVKLNPTFPQSDNLQQNSLSSPLTLSPSTEVIRISF
ncbi:hypothetical protein TRV_07291 [Trichophyton verrucosum HKI 0517]|uniref:Uncharacterized protein n=1 Tax=Trichophyton verrucosum (strain HKI 0517) TaxID=663202 RepID=D4DJC5_TRIVH|nr:uncharacterized protein TRV_07291 [Trichophyton verrucosum HKI 0517]EFE38040.1 hypothetical protein TRV_07291 [Trichophyton verrucosum HKI 0517]